MACVCVCTSSDIEVGLNQTSYTVMESVGSQLVCVMLFGELGTDVDLQLQVYNKTSNGEHQILPCITFMIEYCVL